MLRCLLVVAVAGTLSAGIGYAGQSNLRGSAGGSIPLSSNGPEMFAKYCTPCHGVDGKGHGPIPTAQNTSAVDLTVLSKNNHGKFPQAHVVKVLLYGSEIPSHTSIEMPVWGPVFGKINRDDPKDKTARINNLSHYLETMQVK